MDYVITRAKEDESDELMHYGVLGMKWGKRKAVPTSSTSSKVQSTKAQYKQAKAERKSKINSVYRDITKNSTTGEKLIYNNATRRKAAKYVVDQNMSMQDAKNKANADARRNTAIYLGAIGAYTLANLYAANR